jgi:hypothetical protein
MNRHAEIAVHLCSGIARRHHPDILRHRQPQLIFGIVVSLNHRHADSMPAQSRHLFREK